MTGLLLAGGASSRMGQDKALLVHRGEPLAVHAARALSACCADVLVAGGRGGRLTLLGLPQVPDEPADAGPLGGIVAGLRRAPRPLVAVVACDVAEPDPGVLALLARRWAGEPALVPTVGGRLQPLHALWASACAEALAACLAGGQRSVTAAAQALGARVVQPAEWAQATPRAGFAGNLNTPGDLRGLPAVTPTGAGR